MNSGHSLALALMAIASLPLAAQRANVSAGAHASSASTAVNYALMRPVSGVLTATLESKSARAGELVVLKTTRQMQMADGTVLPKGSRLLGRVTMVQPHDKSHETSWIAILFDQAAPKKGQSFPIHSMIESASLPAGVQGEERTRGWGLTGPGPDGPAFGGRREAGTATAGSAMAGHGLVGDAVLTADANGGQIHPSFDEAATGIPNVSLTGDPSGATSGQFSAAKKNFRLDSETQMVVGIVAAGK